MQGVQDISNYTWLIIVGIVAVCVIWSNLKESKNKLMNSPQTPIQ